MAESYLSYEAVGQIDYVQILNTSRALMSSYNSQKVPVGDVRLKMAMVYHFTPLKLAKLKSPTKSNIVKVVEQ